MNELAGASACVQSVRRAYRWSGDLCDSNDVRALAFKHIPIGARVLDVGCSTGDFGKAIHDQLSASVWGIDADPTAVQLACQSGSYVQVNCIDLDSTDLKAVYGELRFDFVVALDILEHLREPALALKRFTDLLTSDGMVVLSIPNIAHGSVVLDLTRSRFSYADDGLLDRTHLRFFTRESIAELLTDCCLEVAHASFKIVGFEYLFRSCGVLRSLLVAQSDDAFIFNYVILASRCGPDRALSKLFASNALRPQVGDHRIRTARFRLLKELLVPFGTVRHRLLRNVWRVVLFVVRFGRKSVGNVRKLSE